MSIFPTWYDERRLLTGNTLDTINGINRFLLPEYWDEMDGTRQFVFITRPDLYLFNGGTLVPGVDRIPYMDELFNHDQGKAIINSLQTTGSSFPTGWLPVISNKCRGYSPVDDEIEAVERGETYFGHKIIYAKHNFKTRSAGSISIPFVDNKQLAVYKTIKTWVDYMEHVSIGLCSPMRQYILQPQLDYAVSLYYLVTRLDMREIIYWEKLVGVFPTNVPNSTFVNQLGQDIEPQYNITFRYSMKDRSMNPTILSELNLISQKFDTNPTSNYLPNWDTANNMHGEPYVSAPFVVRQGGKFVLYWR